MDKKVLIVDDSEINRDILTEIVSDKYETLHLMGHKRVFPYRFEAQERALMGGMRGVAFSALLGLDDFRNEISQLERINIICLQVI